MYISDYDQPRHRSVEIRFRVTPHPKSDFIEIDEGVIRDGDVFVASGE